MRERRMLGSVGLACLLLVSGPATGTGRVLAGPPAPAVGTISSDNGHFEPIAQDGCVVTFLHVDVHELTGAIEGLMIEEGIFVLDTCTGEGYFSVEATFVGTVLGSESGTARLKVEGPITSFVVSEGGRFVISHGEGGLSGVHAWGSFDYIVGVGGCYDGLAIFDRR